MHGKYTYNSSDLIISNQDKNDAKQSEVLEVLEPQAINITYGYSRDHRPDLKQFIVDLICSGDGDIPIFFKSASGNEADSSIFAKILVDFKKHLQTAFL